MLAHLKFHCFCLSLLSLQVVFKKEAMKFHPIDQVHFPILPVLWLALVKLHLAPHMYFDWSLSSYISQPHLSFDWFPSSYNSKPHLYFHWSPSSYTSHPHMFFDRSLSSYISQPHLYFDWSSSSYTSHPTCILTGPRQATPPNPTCTFTGPRQATPPTQQVPWQVLVKLHLPTPLVLWLLGLVAGEREIAPRAQGFRKV